MTDKKLFVPVLLGTNREGRESEKVAAHIVSEIETREDIETTLVDVRDFAFPADRYGQDIKEQFPEWKETIEKADGLIIVTPEYNHGYPGPLKSVLDLLHDEYKNKVVGIAGVSSGSWGGTRVIENLLPVVRELGLLAIRRSLMFHSVGSQEIDEEAKERTQKFLDEMVFVGESLRWGRENIL